MENEIKNIIANHLENLEDFQTYMAALTGNNTFSDNSRVNLTSGSMSNFTNLNSDVLPMIDINRIKKELEETMKYVSGFKSGANIK